jgi:hypothetical protein
MRYAKRKRCVGGHVYDIYDKRLWQWRFNRCDTCHLTVLPYAVRWVDPRWLSYAIRRRLARV